MRAGYSSNPPRKLRYFTGSLPTKQFDFSKRSQTILTRPKPKTTKTRAARRWEPQDGPQALAYTSRADVTGYGGAAGGGKTDLLLGLAGAKHRRSIIYRRIFPSVRGIIERSREVFSSEGQTHATDSYNEQLHIWRLSSRRVIEFAAMQYEKDKEKYRGRPHDFYGFDEATEFTESQVRFVIGWNRSTYVNKKTKTPQRCRVVMTFNPPMDESGDWVTRFFAPWLDKDHLSPAQDGEIRWFTTDADGRDREVVNEPLGWYIDLGTDVIPCEDGTPFKRGKQWMIPMRGFEEDGKTLFVKSRTFFHASLKDNPLLAATGYGATIEVLPEPLRSLLKGNFDAARVTDPWQVIPSAWIKAAQLRWTAKQPDDSLLSVGVDVARGGKDKTVIARLYGRWLAPLDKYPGASTPDGPTVAALVLPYSHALLGLFVDVIGVGGAVYDALRGNVRVAGINFAEGVPMERDKTGKLKFRNVRAAAYWRLREALDPISGDSLALPPDAELAADLSAPKWSLTTGGILIESKEDIHERIGRSPDSGDALALAYYGVRQRKNSAIGAFAR